MRSGVSIVTIVAATAIGVALPLAGIDFGVGDESKVVAFVVLTAVAVMDVGLARWSTLPGMRKSGAGRSAAEFTGYSMVDSTGFLAVIVGLATDVPVAPLVPGAIGVAGWYLVRQYLGDWPRTTIGEVQ